MTSTGMSTHPAPKLRVVILTSQGASAARILGEILGRADLTCTDIVLTSTVAGRRGVRLLSHLLRRSGLWYVCWLARRHLPAWLGEVLYLRLGWDSAALPDSVPRLCARLGGMRLHRFRSIADPEALQALRELKPELICTVLFPEKLPRGIIAIPPSGCINLHGSLLPQLRGIGADFKALADGHIEHGVTVHLIDEALDTGPIIAQRRFSIADVTQHQQLAERITEASIALLNQALELAAQGRLTATPQPEEGGSYYSWPTREDIAKAKRRGIRF